MSKQFHDDFCVIKQLHITGRILKGKIVLDVLKSGKYLKYIIVTEIVICSHSFTRLNAPLYKIETLIIHTFKQRSGPN